MKKLRNLIAVLAMMSMAAVLTGCDDDDEDDDDDGGQQPPQIVAPVDEAALTAPNNVYTATVAGDPNPITLRFPAAGQYEITRGGVTQVGTYSGATRTDNTWTLNTTPNAGQQGAEAGVLRLDFTANNAGTWTFTPQGGQAETGTFTVTQGGGTDGGTDGGTNGGTDGGTNGGTDGGGNPNDLTGKTLQLTYAGGGGEKFTFTSATQATYEDGADTATYTYDSTTGRLNLTRAGGQLYEITLAEGGNATVVYRENANAAPQTDPATYTLQ
jgi:hypothetical protein